MNNGAKRGAVGVPQAPEETDKLVAQLVQIWTGLDTLYPGVQALLLTRLCGPHCDGHRVQVRPGTWAPAACDTPGKRPLEKRFNADAIARFERGDLSGRTERLAELSWHVEGGGNVGWVVPTDCLVIDADSAESAALCEKLLSSAPRQRTRNGAHFVVRLRPGEAKSLKAKVKVEIAPGVAADLRTGGKSQIACEPSVHATGAAYSWERPLPADVSQLPKLPESIRAALRAGGAYLGAEPARSRSAKRTIARRPRGGVGEIRKGERNDALFRVACAMRHRGATQNEIFKELWSVNEKFCRPPLDESELKALVQSAARYERGAAG